MNRRRYASLLVLLLLTAPTFAVAEDQWYINGFSGGARAAIPNNDIVRRDLLGADQVAIDVTGTVYAVDSIYERILRVDRFTQTHTTVYTSRPVAPRGLALDGWGHLIVAEPCLISRLEATGDLTPIAGTGVCGFNGDGLSATTSKVNSPTDLFWLSPHLYFVDSLNYRVRFIDGGVLRTLAGSGVAGNSPDGTGALVANMSNSMSRQGRSNK